MKKYYIMRAIFILALFIGLYQTNAYAQLRIDITRGNVEPMPIAIPDFFSQGELQEYGQQISAVLTNNLTRTKLFRAISPEAFIQNTTSISIRPRFADWRLIGTQVMVQGVVSDAGNGKIKVEMRLWDVLSERQMLGKLYSTDAQNWRRIAHIISDEIYKRLTGENGYFDSRIVYIAESGPKNKRVKRLSIMDQDGANHKYLTNGSNLVLTPRFSPTRQEITYLSYFENRPRVYLFNLQTGQRSLVGTFKGMTFAPRFSPDGNGLVMSHAENGNSDIYFMDLRTRKPRRLTNNPAIDTSPSMSPDGQFIAFNSDRGGSAQIYVMRADGSNVKRISFGRGSFTTPVWSPRGDLIAFTWQRNKKFHIGVMRPDGKGKRILTESFLDEAPTWSPNGRILMFFRQSPGERGRTRIYSIDLTGNQNTLLEVLTPGDASDPAWSPLN